MGICNDTAVIYGERHATWAIRRETAYAEVVSIRGVSTIQAIGVIDT